MTPPLRRYAIQLIDTFVGARAKTGVEWSASELVDHLTRNGVIPDEQFKEVITKDPMLCNVMDCFREWVFDALCAEHFRELRQ